MKRIGASCDDITRSGSHGSVVVPESSVRSRSKKGRGNLGTSFGRDILEREGGEDEISIAMPRYEDRKIRTFVSVPVLSKQQTRILPEIAIRLGLRQKTPTSRSRPAAIVWPTTSAIGSSGDTTYQRRQAKEWKTECNAIESRRLMRNVVDSDWQQRRDDRPARS